MKNTAQGFVLIVLLVISACSTLESNATSSPDSIGPSMTSTPFVKLQNRDVFCPSENEDAQNFYNDASILKERGDFDGAEELYLKAIELDPNYCDAMDNMGQLLRQQNNIDEAIKWYTKSLEIMPENTVALQNLAVAYQLQGATEKAIEQYEKLVEVAPENPEGHFGLGNIYYYLKQPEKAIPYFETAEKLYDQNASPYLADAQYYLGFSYFMNQDCISARKYLEPIYAQFSEDGGTNYVLGLCFLAAEPTNKELAREYVLKAQALGMTIPGDILSAIEGN